MKDCFVESQFGDLKEIYGKKEQTATPSATPSASKPQTPEIAKVEEKVHNMQEGLTHGKISSYSSRISTPPPTKSASKKQESAKGMNVG